jgi:hypothetical protein
MSAPSARQCFVSYAHHDHRACDRVSVHMKAVGNAFGFSIWADHKLRAGSVWSTRLDKEIKKSCIFVLIVTNDFLASDYIRDYELPAIKSMRDKKGALVVPIILRDCGWQYLCDAYVQAVPMNSKRRIVPCLEWKDTEKAYAVCAREIGVAVSDWFGWTAVSPFAQRAKK